MSRILTQVELKHLTIPRLQTLLKVTRARAHGISYCDCCGTSYGELYGPKDDRAVMGIKLYEYVDRIKARLHEVQG